MRRISTYCGAHCPLFALAVCLSVFTGRAAAVDLVGYIPDYRMTSNSYVQNVLPRQVALLDEVRYFGISVDSNGSGALTTTNTNRNDIGKLRQIIDALPADRRPRLDIALGGWGKSSGFAAIAADATKRATLAQNINTLLNETGATSVDFDWEHPVGATELSNYASMLQRTKQELGAGRRVYATVEPTKFLPPSVFQGANAIDGISLMTYDLGHWANDPQDPSRGEHSLQDFAEDALQAWNDPVGTLTPPDRNGNNVYGQSWGNNTPPQYLGVGLPFYGRPIGTSQSPLTGEPAIVYSDLISGGTTTDQNEFNYGNPSQKYWLPGPNLVAQRVHWSHQKGLKNIIIWELWQDLDPNHQHSLLRAAFNTTQTIVGDFDGDRDVDPNDYAVWRSTYGSTTDRRADADGNLVVDTADYIIWRDNMTAGSAAAGASAVPEPTSPTLVVACCCCASRFFARRRRR